MRDRRRNAVQHDVAGGLLAAVDDEPVGGERVIDAAGLPHEEHPRDKRRKLVDIPAIERQIENPLVLHHGAQRGGSRFEHLRLSRHFHLLGDRPQCHNDIHGGALLRGKRQRVQRVSPESNLFGGDAVGARRQLRHHEKAGAVGCRPRVRVLLSIGYGYDRTGHDRACRIGNQTRNRSRERLPKR